MHFKLNKYIIEQSIKFLRRIFTYNNKWSNLGIETIQVSSGSSLIYEAFANEPEHYPIVLVSAGGGNYTRQSFNDLWSVVDNDKISLGKRSLSYVKVTQETPLTIYVDYNLLKGNIIRGIDIYAALTEESLNKNDLMLNVYENNIVIASASIKDIKSFSNYFTEFSNYFSIKEGSDYKIEFFTLEDSNYYVMIDNTIDYLTYMYENSLYSGSVVGNLYLPPFISMGGTFDSNVQFVVQSKNDTASVYNITELIAMYFTLAKHCQISRSTGSINGLKLSGIEENIINSELTERGIYVKNITQSGITTRKRGEKDIIFSSTVTVNFYTEWYENYPVSTIGSINVDAKSFNENLFS